MFLSNIIILCHSPNAFWLLINTFTAAIIFFIYFKKFNLISSLCRIMVLDAGEIAEFDSPQSLLANKNSIFYGMAKDAGLAD